MCCTLLIHAQTKNHTASRRVCTRAYSKRRRAHNPRRAEEGPRHRASQPSRQCSRASPHRHHRPHVARFPQIRDARPQASPPGRTWPPSCTVQAIASHHHSCVPTARAPPHRPSSKPPLLAILRPTRGDTYLGAADDVDRRLLPHARAAQVTGDPRASRRGGWARPTLCTETDRGS